MKKKLILALKIVICIFAVIGFGFIAVYFAVRLNLTNTPGIIDTQNDYFKNAALAPDSIDASTTCTLIVGNTISRPDVLNIFAAYDAGGSPALIHKMASAFYLELGKYPDFEASFASCVATEQPMQMKDIENKLDTAGGSSVYPWANGEEWQTLQAALIKDAPTILKAANDAQVEPRLLVSALMVEQLRLFYTDREVFKEVFAPLKILGVQSQFSWGVMGIKPDTAIEIEDNLSSTTSDFYPGAAYQHLLDFQTTDHDTERFNRLTDQHDHYYSYLYAGLYMKEIESQWQKAGYDISDRPEILTTLFNIGFDGSKPSADPAVGGSEITIGSNTYSFGSLANEFYYSGLLIDYFPYTK